MRFESFEQLKAYTGKWLSQSELELLWQQVQKGLVTEDKIIEITEQCCCDEQCMADSIKHNAWKNFINNYTKGF